jgi:hypothetical protein
VYKASIEYSIVVEMEESPEKKISYAILLLFKQLYTAGTLNLDGQENPLITGDKLESLFLVPPPPIKLQNQLITLMYNAFRIKHDILFTIEDLIVSTGYTQKNIQNALDYLKEIRIITKRPSCDENNVPLKENFLDEKYSIESKILEEHDKLKETSPQIPSANKFFRKIEIEPKSEFCFVMMAFKEQEFPQKWYKNLLKPFIEQEFKIKCVRVDEDMFPYKIDDKIFTYISDSKFILAEISTLNPNVMYEVGMAHTLNKDVILITKGDISRIPFDINKIPVFKYEDEENLKDFLRNAIPKLI